MSSNILWLAKIDTDPQWELGYICPRPICMARLNSNETLCWKCGELVKPFKIGYRYEYTGESRPIFPIFFLREYKHEKILKFLSKSDKVETFCSYCSYSMDNKTTCSNCGSKG